MSIATEDFSQLTNDQQLAAILGNDTAAMWSDADAIAQRNLVEATQQRAYLFSHPTGSLSSISPLDVALVAMAPIAGAAAFGSSLGGDIPVVDFAPTPVDFASTAIQIYEEPPQQTAVESTQTWDSPDVPTDWGASVIASALAPTPFTASGDYDQEWLRNALEDWKSQQTPLVLSDEALAPATMPSDIPAEPTLWDWLNPVDELLGASATVLVGGGVPSTPTMPTPTPTPSPATPISTTQRSEPVSIWSDISGWLQGDNSLLQVGTDLLTDWASPGAQQSNFTSSQNAAADHPAGYHWTKNGKLVKNRRVNPLNIHALRRALRRAEGFIKIEKRVDKIVNRAARYSHRARAHGFVRSPIGRRKR